MPDSCISSHRSLPSRVRSPTPEKTETPPCFMAMLDQRHFGLRVIVRVHDAGLLHLEPQVVAFAGALAHAGKDRNAAVLHGDVVNQFLNDDFFADARAAEQADLAAAQGSFD